MKNLELVDYVFSHRCKKWYQYGLDYYCAHIKRIFYYFINQPLCFLGIHHIYDGLFHTCITESIWYGETEQYKDTFKCYHCRYCNKPADEKIHAKAKDNEK